MSLESFSKKGRADAAVRTGKAKIDASNTRGNVGFGDSGNDAKLQLARSGARDMMEGTMEKNKLAQSTDDVNDRSANEFIKRIPETVKNIFLKLTD
jgi:hypothetical protein